MEIVAPSYDNKIDQKLADYLIYDIDIEAIIKIVEKYHNEATFVDTLKDINMQYKDWYLAGHDTTNFVQADAPQFQVFHLLRKELEGSPETLHKILEELYSDEAMTGLIEKFEEKTDGIAIVGAIQANEALQSRYTDRLAIFRNQLYTYLTNEHKESSATMNYVMVTKKTLAELLRTDYKARAENWQNATASV